MDAMSIKISFLFQKDLRRFVVRSQTRSFFVQLISWTIKAEVKLEILALRGLFAFTITP